MTRFMKEISGLLDREIVERRLKSGESVGNPHFWEERAKDRVVREIMCAKEEAIVERDGAIRWVKSGNYLPDDVCEVLEYGGFEFSREATREAKRKQDEAWLEEYRAKKRECSFEEIEEMRAVFGKGKTIVNIITGESVVL